MLFFTAGQGGQIVLYLKKASRQNFLVNFELSHQAGDINAAETTSTPQHHNNLLHPTQQQLQQQHQQLQQLQPRQQPCLYVNCDLSIPPPGTNDSTAAVDSGGGGGHSPHVAAPNASRLPPLNIGGGTAAGAPRVPPLHPDFAAPDTPSHQVEVQKFAYFINFSASVHFSLNIIRRTTSFTPKHKNLPILLV